MKPRKSLIAVTVLLALSLAALYPDILPDSHCSRVMAASGKKGRAVKKAEVKIGGVDYSGKTYTLERGRSITLSVDVTPAGAKKSVSYAAGNRGIAKVGKKGKVTAKKAGTTKITVTVKGKNNKKKKIWLKIRVVNQKPETPKPSEPSASKKPDQASPKPSELVSCSHSWVGQPGGTADTRIVIAQKADYYNVCMSCGFIAEPDHATPIMNHTRYAPNYTCIQVGPQKEFLQTEYRQTFKCTKCGKTENRSWMERGQERIRYYQNPYLNPGACAYAYCSVCGEGNMKSALIENQGICSESVVNHKLYGDELHEDIGWEDHLIYPWQEGYHYKDITEKGEVMIVK